MSQLNLDSRYLPDLPQIATVLELVRRLWDYPELQAIWLAGSLAQASADPYSDIDLRLAISEEALADWQDPDWIERLGEEPLAYMSLRFSEDNLLHHMLLENGMILDLYVQTHDQPMANERRHIFGYRDEDLYQRLLVQPQEQSIHYPEATAVEVEAIIVSYWLHAHKHRKVLYRGLDLILWEGLNLFRPVLLRLTYILLTGRDSGDWRGSSIHRMTTLVKDLEAAPDRQFLRVIGLATETRSEKIEAVSQLNAAVAKVGRSLAKRYDFDYPDSLENLVRSSWRQFCQDEW